MCDEDMICDRCYMRWEVERGAVPGAQWSEGFVAFKNGVCPKCGSRLAFSRRRFFVDAKAELARRHVVRDEYGPERSIET